MSFLRLLPPPLKTVVAPDCFSVTALVSSSNCRLRAVLASSKPDSYQLPAGPEAAIGTLVHKVKENWAGRTDGSLTPEELFDAEYAALVKQLGSDPDRQHFADLAATRSPSEWSMVRRQAIAQCSVLSPVAETGARRGVPPKGPRVGSEIDLESRILRIRGRADRIDKEKPSTWVVRDYKTGSATTPEGEPRPDYALQMQCYGLMITEASPHSEARLILHDGDEHVVPFDKEARDATRQFLKNATARMPSGGSIVESTELANPGLACVTCTHRVVCTAYQRHAPHWWRRYPTDIDRIPFDTWGSVVEIVHGEQTSLTLEDDAGRKVRIDRIDTRHGLLSAREGDRVWMFSLNSVGVARGFDGRRFHPRNFFELPRDRRERRAWGLVTFAEHPR